MKVINVHSGLVIAALLASGGALSEPGGHGWYGTEQAFAASPEQTTQARRDLDQVIASLRMVDTAYASGNAAEAQTKFEEAQVQLEQSCSRDLGARGAGGSAAVRLPRYH